MSPTENWWRTLDGSENDHTMINIYIVEEIDRGDRDVSGTSMQDFQNGDIMLERSVFATRNSRTTFAHELGHSFSLAHTHRNSERNTCWQEPVSRTRGFNDCLLRFGTMCRKTADGLCDTPADYDIRSANGDINTADCTHTGFATDNWGDTYAPDVSNIMATGNRMCRNNFTFGQTQAMSYQMTNMRNGTYNTMNHRDDIVWPDTYEPDNTNTEAATSRYISIGETQHHTFHGVPTENGTCNDTEDWIAIESQQGHLGTYQLTFDSPCEESPIGQIQVWLVNENTGELLNRSSTITATSLPQTIDIPCDISSGDIRVRIIPGVNLGANRNYTVSLENEEGDMELTGTNLPCGDNNFEIQINGQPVPSDHSIDWFLTGQNVLTGILDPTLDGNAGTAVLTGVNLSARPIVNVRVTAPNGCSKTQRLILPIFTGVSAGEISQIYVNSTWDGCEGEFTASINAPEGSTFEWNCENASGHSYFYSNCSESSSSSVTGGTYFYNADQHSLDALFSVTVTDPCGNTTVRTIEYTFNAYDCVGEGFNDNGGVVIYPNPATDEISVLIDNEASDFLYSEYTLYTIYNQFGEIVLEDQKPNGESTLDIHSLNEGLHLLRVTSSTHEIHGSFYKGDL